MAIQTMPYLPYKTGQKLGPFTVTKSVYIKELQSLLTELQHDHSGAQVIHLKNEDPENLFCLAFKTIPEDSTGVAHILEHTVLCGSKKYPVADPFFSMNRRSLNTFMNAMTGADFTCYPASSQIETDFYNLLAVYLDAVFHPLLNELSFLQEGWRYELLDETLQYKGIVYNEMKGALNSSTARIIEKMNQVMFPNITYGFNSGGDPKDIPKLTYDQLKAFHSTYYHPSRCLFYFYGNLPLERHLEFIHENALKDAQHLAPVPHVTEQKRFTSPVRVKDKYPTAPGEDNDGKDLISYGWLTCRAIDQEEILALSVIDIILMGTDASPLKMALLRSGLCKQVNAYLDSDMNEVPVVYILNGCDSNDEPKLIETIRTTLSQLLAEGFEEEDVKSAIHQLELHRSEIINEGSPFGLSLFMRSCLSKLHGGKTEDGLTIHEQFSRLRDHIQSNPRYLEELTQKYLLDNSHFVTVIMEPSETLEKEEEEHEAETLKELCAQLTEQQKEQIRANAENLILFQEQQEEADIEVLPKLTLADIPKEPKYFALEREMEGKTEVFRHECFTNGIFYTDLVFPLPHLPEEDLPYLKLFTSLLSQVGAGGRTYEENLDALMAHTGGIGAYLSLNIQANDRDQFHPSLHIKGKSLHRKIDKLFPLMRDMITSADFTNRDRMRELLMSYHIGMESSLSRKALKYAINLATSTLCSANKVSNDWSGLPFYHLVKELALNFDARIGDLVMKMQELQEKVLCLKNSQLVVGCTQEIYQQIKEAQYYGLLDFKAKDYPNWDGMYKLPTLKSQGRIIASPVAFTAKAFNTLSYAHPDAPALMVASQLFDNITLHKRIREQGGAYGSGSSSNAISGNFIFYSLRDPNICSTIAAFDEAIKRIIDGKFDEKKIEEAILGCIQGMDSPVSPGNRAELAYSWYREGRTQQMRQDFRTRMLNLTKKDIQHAVSRHIAPNFKEGVTVSFGGKELLERENLLLKEKNLSPLLAIYTV